MAEPAIFPLLDLEAATAAAQIAGIPEVLARVNLFRTTLHHPPIGRIVGDVVDALVLPSMPAARPRRTASLPTRWRLGPIYEWRQPYSIGRRAGLSDD